MLKKLLKYDFRAIFKYWWIGALVSFGLSILEAIAIYFVSSNSEPPIALVIVLTLLSIGTIFAYVGFFIVSAILVYVRFYKNFFTDEGYLTFTIPVKRWQLAASKVISGTVTLILTGVVFFIDFVIVLVTAIASNVPSNTFNYYSSVDTLGIEISGGLIALYTLEFLILSILSTAMSVMFVYICITIASMISKKAKVIVAIALYYGINMVLTTVIQIFSSIALSGVSIYLMEMTAQSRNLLVLLGLFGFDILFALIVILMFALIYWLLDRKLNLN